MFQTPVNLAYARNALEKRSMFQRDYYLLLMYCSLTPVPTNGPDPLAEIRQALGNASLLDLVFTLSVKTAQKTLKHSWLNLKSAWNDTQLRLRPFSVIFRLICLPFSLLGTLIMLPVNALYGVLDWVSLKAALFYSARSSSAEKLKWASYVALFTSILTVPLRLPIGLVEAFQEPFHLYDFWVKGAVEAREDYTAGEISGKVYAAKMALHAFKVICTFGAVLTIVGLTVGPVMRFLGQTAHWLIHGKDLLPNAHLIERPINALSEVFAGIEHGVAKTVGVHYSYVSARTNTDKAIELGFESCLTKGAAMLPRVDGLSPMDFRRNRP